MRARFSTTFQTGPGAHPDSYTLGTGSFQGVKRPGPGTDHPPNLTPRLKKEYSCTYTPLWAFVACSRVNCTFTFGFWQRTIFCSYPKLRPAVGPFILAVQWILDAATLLRDSLERGNNTFCVCACVQ